MDVWWRRRARWAADSAVCLPATVDELVVSPKTLRENHRPRPEKVLGLRKRSSRKLWFVRARWRVPSDPVAHGTTREGDAASRPGPFRAARTARRDGPTTRFALLALVTISSSPRPRLFRRALLRQSDDVELAITADAAAEKCSFWRTSMDAVCDKGSNHAAPRLKDHHDNLHRTRTAGSRVRPGNPTPFVAGISSRCWCCPFLVAYNLFSAMGHMLSLQKLLMAINIYNATYCALLVVFNCTRSEPMASLRESSEADTSSAVREGRRVPRVRADPVRTSVC